MPHHVSDAWEFLQTTCILKCIDWIIFKDIHCKVQIFSTKKSLSLSLSISILLLEMTKIHRLVRKMLCCIFIHLLYHLNFKISISDLHFTKYICLRFMPLICYIFNLQSSKKNTKFHNSFHDWSHRVVSLIAVILVPFRSCNRNIFHW